MLSPQQQAIDRIFIEGWNLALDAVALQLREQLANPASTIKAADVQLALDLNRE